MFDLLPVAVALPFYAVILIGLAISALLAGIQYLLRPKIKPPTGRKVVPTYAERGSYVPRVIGTQRIGAVITWIGAGRQNTNDGGKSAAQQQGCHVLCVGPAFALHQILEGGKVIFPTPTQGMMTRETHPSGTSIQLTNGQGIFRIYWGEDDQPIDSVLAAGMGVASRWPNVCYIVWDKKRLNQLNVWPELHYVITVKPRRITIDPDDEIIEGSAGWMEGDVGHPYTTDGVNPAHALVEILTDTFPHGVGLDVGHLNIGYFQDLGTLLETEGQPVNTVINDGEDSSEVVSSILTDISTVMPQVGSQLVVLPIRALADGETYPTLTTAVLVPPYTEKAQQIGLKKADRLIFQYSDRDLRFKDNTITVDNDGEMSQRGAPKTTNVELNTIIHAQIAALVADRRQIEELGGLVAYKYAATHGARALTSGQRFVASPDNILMRVTSISRKTDSPQIEIEAVKDIFAPEPSAYVVDPTEPPVLDGRPYRDEYYDFLELPFALTEGKRVELMVVRQRVSEHIVSSIVLWGHSPSTMKIKDEDFNIYHTRGLLLNDMGEFDPMIQDTGPTISLAASNLDEDEFEDLTNETANWRTGRNIAVIGNEWFFFKKLVFVTGTTWRLDGLIRSRWTTTREAHDNGDVVWLFRHQNDQAIGTNTFTQNLFARNQHVYLEIRTKTDTAILDTEDAEPFADHVIQGLALTPLRPSNFRTDEGLMHSGVPWNTWLAGGPVTFKWSNRSRLANGYTAGTQDTGDLHSPNVVKMDGELVIQIIDPGDDSVKDTLKIKSGTSCEYPNADLVSAFSGEPTSIKAKYWQRIGPYDSVQNTITITRR